MKQINIETVCRASVRESWWVSVPDDFDLSGPDAKVTAGELLDDPAAFGAEILEVFDRVFDEDDREVTGWEEIE